MKKISFLPGGWESAGLEYAYSWRFPGEPVFRQEADCIANSASPEGPGGFDYVGFLLPGEFSVGARVEARCSFEGLAAPMLTLVDRMETDERGVLRTLDFYEAVIWRNGLNIWRHHTAGRNTTHYKALGAGFPLAEGQVHTLSLEMAPQAANPDEDGAAADGGEAPAKSSDKRMVLTVDGIKLDLFIDDLPERFRLGYSACEGVCRLYDIAVG